MSGPGSCKHCGCGACLTHPHAVAAPAAAEGWVFDAAFAEGREDGWHSHVMVNRRDGRFSVFVHNHDDTRYRRCLLQGVGLGALLDAAAAVAVDVDHERTRDE